MRRLRNLLLLTLLAACVASLWWSRREAAPAPGAPPPPTGNAAPGIEAAPVVTVHLRVLNGTGVAGLARRFSRQLSEHGCVVVAMADAPHDTFSSSLLINRRLDEDEARRLAARLGGLPVLREWDPRGREDAVLVLGRDHGRLAGTSRR